VSQQASYDFVVDFSFYLYLNKQHNCFCELVFFDEYDDPHFNFIS